jgi:hypothetical protein
MKQFFTGLLIGVIGSCLILNDFPWSTLFSITIIKAGFAIFLALSGGLIALYQVKANVISSARIKWIEDFKTNIAEYSSTTNSSIFNFREYADKRNGDARRTYHQQYMNDVQKIMSIKGKILMNLNRNENSYEKIYQIVNRIEVLTAHDNLDSICQLDNYLELESQFDLLNIATNEAMKFEWEKAKKMFYSRWIENWFLKN